METSLHRQLKEIYAAGDATVEMPLGKFRIDVVCGDELVEIQHGSLAAIEAKVAELVTRHRVLVVKPIVVQKQLVKCHAKSGRVLSRRISPKQGRLLDLFEELVYFRRVFPHPNLVLEVVLVDVEEWRFPGHGRRRRWRAKDYQVEDQKLLQIHRVHRFRTANDLLGFIPAGLPSPFHTGQLADTLAAPRWLAQRIAYCFRHMNLVREVGKAGNARLYQLQRNAEAA